MILPPETCSCAALRQATRHVSRSFDTALAPLGLSLNQYSVLAKLRRHGPLCVQDLAELLVMDRSSLGHLLRPLERDGLLAIGAGEGDRRRKAIALTAVGRERATVAEPVVAQAQARFDAAFGREESASLRAVLRRVTTLSLEPA